MYSLGRITAWCAGLVLIVLPGMADPFPQCASGNLASILGTTCMVGHSLQFTFTDWANTVGVDVPPYYVSGVAPASDFRFTVLSNGFMVSGSPRTLTLESFGQQGQHAIIDWGVLEFSLYDPIGWVLGYSATSSSRSVTGSAFSGVGIGLDGYLDELMQRGGQFDESARTVGSQFFYESNGEATVYRLWADGPDDSAYWAGSTIFMYVTTPETPEPSAYLLFGTIVGLIYIARRKRRILKTSA
jgi:hypothetical protein